MIVTTDSAAARGKLSDSLAIGLSLLCLAHCLGLSVLAAVMPLVATTSLAFEHYVHDVLFMLAVPISLFALWSGWQRHRRLFPSAAVTGGLSVMFVGLFLTGEGHAETIVSVIGALIVATGHYFNWRLLKPSGKSAS